MRSTFNGEKLALFGLIFRLLMGAARGDQIAGTTPRQFPGNGFRRRSNLKVLEDEIDKVDGVDLGILLGQWSINWLSTDCC